MKNLLIQTANHTSVVDAEALAKYLEENAGDSRAIDEVLLSAPNFTEDMVLKLFGQALEMEFFSDDVLRCR